MSAEIKSHIVDLLTRALAKVAPQQPGSLISLERPKQAHHGDFSSPLAMQLSRQTKRPPVETAQALVEAIPPSDWSPRNSRAPVSSISECIRPRSSTPQEKYSPSGRTTADRTARAGR